MWQPSPIFSQLQTHCIKSNFPRFEQYIANNYRLTHNLYVRFDTVVFANCIMRIENSRYYQTSILSAWFNWPRCCTRNLIANYKYTTPVRRMYRMYFRKWISRKEEYTTRRIIAEDSIFFSSGPSYTNYKREIVNRNASFAAAINRISISRLTQISGLQTREIRGSERARTRTEKI